MTFNSPTPMPPAPPARKSRSGGFILLLAGALAAVSPFIDWVPERGGTSLKELVSSLPEAGGLDLLDNPRTWFYSILGGAGVAILFGLIGLAVGGSGSNVTAGVFGLFAACAIAYPPVSIITNSNTSAVMKELDVGFYCAAGAGFLALVGMLLALIGATKK